MNRLLKTSIIISVSVLFVIILTLLYNKINIGISHYVYTEEDSILFDRDNMKDILYTLVLEEASKITEEREVTIHNQSGKSMTLLLDYLKEPFELYINGRLVAQNINPSGPQYEDPLSYITTEIYGTKRVTLRGKNLQFITWYMAESHIMTYFEEIRELHYFFTFFCYIFMGLICIILFFSNRFSKYFLLLGIIGIMSAYKVIVLGEIPVLTHLFHITIYNYHQQNVVTSLLNILFPLYITAYLYDLRLNWTYKILSYVFLCILSILVLDIHIYNQVFTPILIGVTLTGVAIQLYGTYKKKPYSFPILINTVFYLSTSFYKSFMDTHIMPKGTIDCLLHFTYLGAVIYLAGFMGIFICRHLGEIKLLKKKEREYERVSMLRGISHDLKHPLSVIKSSNQIIQHYRLSHNESAKYLKTSLDAASELERMTDNISSYLKVGARDKSNNHLTDLKDSLESLIEQFTVFSTDKDKELYIEGEIEKLENIRIPMDPALFYRLLFNLLDNAFKYSRENAIITLSYCVDQEAIFIIQDQGQGIPQSKLDKLCNPFYRVEQSRTKEGLGLGLSVVKSIVEQAKGRLEINSILGVGTTVTIRLPYERKRNLTV